MLISQPANHVFVKNSTKLALNFICLFIYGYCRAYVVQLTGLR